MRTRTLNYTTHTTWPDDMEFPMSDDNTNIYYAEIILPISDDFFEHLQRSEYHRDLYGFDIILYLFTMLEDIYNWGTMPLEAITATAMEYYIDCHDDHDIPSEWQQSMDALQTEFYWLIYRAYGNIKSIILDQPEYDFSMVHDYQLLNNGLDGIVLLLIYEEAV
jgi:hypothetical protein